MTNYGYAKIIGKTKKSIFCLSLFCGNGLVQWLYLEGLIAGYIFPYFSLNIFPYFSLGVNFAHDFEALTHSSKEIKTI
jgi:hypothetical protein